MIPIKNSDFIFKETDGGSILLNGDTGDYFGLNEVGTDFIKLIDGKKDLNEIIIGMMELYDIDETTLRKDIGELIDKMQKKDILHIIND